MSQELDSAHHERPYPLENTGSRPLSPSQTSEGWISSWVGDAQRIPGVVRLSFFFSLLFFLLFLSNHVFYIFICLEVAIETLRSWYENGSSMSFGVVEL